MHENMKAVVLAAGKGTRLNSEGAGMPKVLRPALGRPLISYVLSALDFIAPEDTVLVVGFMKEAVMEAFPEYGFAVQEQQLGTGHAVMAAAPALTGHGGDVLVCCGDMPLLRRETYRALVEQHVSEGNACTVLSGTGEEIRGYGRIVRDESGGFAGVVEEKDCSPEQLEIRELNSGVYVFNTAALLNALGKLGRNNAQNEYYLTDAPLIIKDMGLPVGVCVLPVAGELLGVNTPEQLAETEARLRAREG